MAYLFDEEKIRRYKFGLKSDVIQESLHQINLTYSVFVSEIVWEQYHRPMFRCLSDEGTELFLNSNSFDQNGSVNKIGVDWIRLFLEELLVPEIY